MRWLFPSTLRNRLLLVLLSLAALPSVLIGVLAYRNARLTVEARVQAQLTSIATLKKTQLTTWIADRVADARLLGDNFLNEEHFAEILDPRTPAVRRAAFAGFLTDNLFSLQHTRQGYDEILFVDIAGHVVLSTDHSHIGTNLASDPAVPDTLTSATGQFISEIHRRGGRGPLEIVFGHVLHAVDLSSSKTLPRLNGAVIIRVRMADTVYAFLREWPDKGATSEAFLVQARGQTVHFVSPLRFDTRAPTEFAVPLGSPSARLARLALSGDEGILATTDYRGVSVLAAYRAIPVTGWGFVAKVDTSEAFAPVAALTRDIALATAVVLWAAAVAGAVLAGGLTHPLTELVTTAKSVAAGKYETEIDVRRNDEFGVLAQSFRHMIEAVRQRNEALTRANAELAQLAAIVQFTDDAIFRVALQGTLTSWNAGAEKMFGYSAEEIIGRPVTILYPDDRHGEQREVQARSERGEHLTHFETVRVRKGGTQIQVSLTISPIRDDAGTIIGSSHIARDITERRQAEEALWKAHEAARANREKSEFLSRMSHELRTPLNAVLGFAQVLEMDPLSPEQREGVGHILQGGRHLLELINEVLDISRIESGWLAIALGPVPLNAVVQETLDLITPLAAKANVRLHTEAAVLSERNILADRQRFKQVLLNLLSNAVKYNRQGGSVTLSYEEAPEGRLRIKVSDTGPGIPPEKMERLFTPFERLGAEQTGVEGTGLGLVLSKRLVEAMQGTLGAQSTEGTGSTFWVELARADAPIQERALDGPRVAPRAESDAPSRPRTVLCIEDNLSNFDVIRHLLARRPGIRLLSAMQGQVGLDLAREHHPDLVLLDLHLPDIPGDTVLRRLREDPRTRRIPVAIISADAMPPGQIDHLLAAGAQAYLTKPVEVKKFIAFVNEILGKREEEEDAGSS